MDYLCDANHHTESRQYWGANDDFRKNVFITFLLLFSDISWYFKLHMLIESMTFDLLADLRLCLLNSCF